MNSFTDAKERYNSIKIPQELGSVVEKAIGSSSNKKDKKLKLYTLRIIPVAVCAVACIVIGINHFSYFGKCEDEGKAVITNDVTASYDLGGDETADRSFVAAGKRLAPDDFTEKKEADKCEAVVEMMDKSIYNSFVQAKFDESVSECVELENSSDAYGELKEIYSDEDVVSYSVTTYPSNATNFYNIKQSDGSDILIQDIMGDDFVYVDECEFYIKARNKIVIIQNGEESEVILE